ncbi:hypothetical protein HETIRDRAFT_456500 [Heterobasidion irregulare TC 32-1]|uniref:Uncharacterized protein n=1 Tax=Heterobasidion irregulare (strain TC 32-1) TaxID=747525 RepID=W4JNC9_HETIT|nr:uncharacterized protein HETIRDRAFT_456500 [Heterobasidion irregulare TC 32-1]ETW75048.1 hypothetical protein HETIRDRAFT_456500 [Heterobasidion irregulare TC 32-1]
MSGFQALLDAAHYASQEQHSYANYEYSSTAFNDASWGLCTDNVPTFEPSSPPSMPHLMRWSGEHGLTPAFSTPRSLTGPSSSSFPRAAAGPQRRAKAHKRSVRFAYTQTTAEERRALKKRPSTPLPTLCKALPPSPASDLGAPSSAPSSDSESSSPPRLPKLRIAASQQHNIMPPTGTTHPGHISPYGSAGSAFPARGKPMGEPQEYLDARLRRHAFRPTELLAFQPL